MPADVSKAFRLSVWRPAQFARRVVHHPGPGKTSDPADGFLEQIYAWDPGEVDVWASVPNSRLQNKLSSLLVEAFDPGKSPGERAMKQFRAAVEEAIALLSGSSTGWVLTPATVPTGDDPANLRANPTLAMLMHFQWVATVFEHVPGASVAVR